jgi:hypothetical protein
MNERNQTARWKVSLEDGKDCEAYYFPRSCWGFWPSSDAHRLTAQQAALAMTELHFDINARQAIEPGLYRCPAGDKPICNPDYNGQAECVRVRPKGSVFVQSGFAN